MPSEEEKGMAIIAAGGDNGVFAFMQMARRFYDRDGEQGLKVFTQRAFQTMPKADQTSTVAVALGELFFSSKQNLN